MAALASTPSPLRQRQEPIRAHALDVVELGNVPAGVRVAAECAAQIVAVQQFELHGCALAGAQHTPRAGVGLT